MKKNLLILTGIVFLMTILAACGGRNESNPNNSVLADNDTTTIYIYLKAALINGSMHLAMWDSKKPKCPVIDNLVTVVYSGNTVIWKKAPNSNIDKIISISPLDDVNIFRNGVKEIEVDSTWTLKIPDNSVTPDTVKYIVVFTVKKDTITIDPYLEFPDERQ